jgi:formate dehydrogenase subunit delta
MNTETLIRMANQIAANFHAYPEDEAVEAIANHLRQFWEPHMRAGLRAAVAKGQANGLAQPARDALALIDP